MMKAKDVMTSPVVSVEQDSTVLQAVRIMLQRRVSGLPVVDREGKLIGIVTEGDFLRRAETKPSAGARAGSNSWSGRVAWPPNTHAPTAARSAR